MHPIYDVRSKSLQTDCEAKVALQSLITIPHNALTGPGAILKCYTYNVNIFIYLISLRYDWLINFLLSPRHSAVT